MISESIIFIFHKYEMKMNAELLFQNSSLGIQYWISSESKYVWNSIYRVKLYQRILKCSCQILPLR